ncbi:MAG: glycosyltransferase family 2 protein [Succinivibrio sp.]|nr:glycosyltransferase family 2 protein [Succinivibrio sp.]
MLACEPRLPLTVIVLARNEEDHLDDCLNSAAFAAEILLINNNSTDRTAELALAHQARVLNRDLDNDFAAQRNFALSKATYDWVFMLDADERITPELEQEICRAVEANEDRCYCICRENHFVQGKVLHGDLRPDHVERLFRKAVSHYEGRVHERLHTSSPRQKLNGRLIHFPYRSWEAHLNKLNVYSSLVAQKYYEQGKSCSYPVDIALKPLWACFKMYVIHRGFLDGRLGLVFAVLHYFYTLEKYLKLYSLIHYGGRM